MSNLTPKKSRELSVDDVVRTSIYKEKGVVVRLNPSDFKLVDGKLLLTKDVESDYSCPIEVENKND
jgi:hypothetical protein